MDTCTLYCLCDAPSLESLAKRLSIIPNQIVDVSTSRLNLSRVGQVKEPLGSRLSGLSSLATLSPSSLEIHIRILSQTKP